MPGTAGEWRAEQLAAASVTVISALYHLVVTPHTRTGWRASIPRYRYRIQNSVPSPAGPSPLRTSDRAVGLFPHEHLHAEILPARVIGTQQHPVAGAIACSAIGSTGFRGEVGLGRVQWEGRGNREGATDHCAKRGSREQMSDHLHAGHPPTHHCFTTEVQGNLMKAAATPTLSSAPTQLAHPPTHPISPHPPPHHSRARESSM